ncbi:MAG: tail fiber domain-containing protein, partial [Bacteroidales bacterium]|nr:tail fiber domain-containing protein [Bacteroidales bacterium]
GNGSTAIGYYTVAESYVSVAMGSYNVGGGNPTSWVATDPLFEIGNGIFTSNSNALTVLKNGNVGIGTTSPTHILHVTGIARSTQSTWATSSDARVKENIHKIEGSLAVIEQLRPVSYNYTDEYIGGNQEMVGLQRGFIAQEVKEVVPEMVTTCTESFAGKTIEDFHLLNTSDMTPFLVSAVQEQQDIIDELNQQIQQLRLEMHQLRTKIDEQSPSMANRP